MCSIITCLTKSFESQYSSLIQFQYFVIATSFNMASSFLKSHIFFRDWIRSLSVGGDWDLRAYTSHQRVPASILLPCHGMSLCRSDIYDQKMCYSFFMVIYRINNISLFVCFVLSILTRWQKNLMNYKRVHSDTRHFHHPCLQNL